MSLTSVVIHHKWRESESCEVSHPLSSSMSVGSRVAEPLNRDTLLAAILASRVVCVSMRDWTSSVVGRTSSCTRERRVHLTPGTNWSSSLMWFKFEPNSKVKFNTNRLNKLWQACKLKLRSFRCRTHTHLLLIDVVSRKVNIHCILVIHDSPDPGHGCIEQTFLLVQRSLLLSIWKCTGVRQKVHVCDLKVPHTYRE